MSDIGERQIEASQANLLLLNQVRINDIRAELAASEEEDCIDCGRPIGEARKVALPSAERCIGCQTSHERRTRV